MTDMQLGNCAARGNSAAYGWKIHTSTFQKQNVQG
jgi:hypothetical protein